MARPKGTNLWRGQVRVPEPVMNWVKERAETNFRSLNAEIVELLIEIKSRKQENAAQ